jgi:hypothetical protein
VRLSLREYSHVLLILALFNSGQVFRGEWNKTEVALKVLRTQAGVIPGSMVSDTGDWRPLLCIV